MKRSFQADFIIHLLVKILQKKDGQPKAEIIDSREQSTSTVVFGVKKSNKKLEAFISASAIGIYGVNGQEICTEQMAPANDFAIPVRSGRVTRFYREFKYLNGKNSHWFGGKNEGFE
jgi:NAD dependent epimerase/dehydratase family enzyme